jgi:hypothetical protein
MFRISPAVMIQEAAKYKVFETDEVLKRQKFMRVGYRLNATGPGF